MIAKGNLHAHGQKLAAYLITGKMHERAELVELRGFASSNIRDAFVDVMIQAEATRCEKPFFHAHVRLPEGEQLSREQWQRVAGRIEKQLGFDGQGRAVAFHEDRRSGERHLHIAWSRIDLEQMRAIDPGLYKNKLKEVSRQLERELGLTRVRNERDPEQQKTLAPGRNEFEQSRRLGTDLRAILENIRACWERSDSGRSFAAALEERGYVLARGDRRDFVVVDRAGGDHALAKRIVGVAAPEIRARLADIDRAQLPSVDQAKTRQAEHAWRPVERDRLPPTPAVEQTPAAAAPERTQTHERPAAPQEPDPAIPSPTVVAREHSDASRTAGGILGSLGAAVEKLFDALAIMISPPAPPTPEQQKLDVQAAEERSVERAAERKGGEEDLRLRLEQQIKDDLAREQKGRDEDYHRGRERER